MNIERTAEGVDPNQGRWEATGPGTTTRRNASTSEICLAGRRFRPGRDRHRGRFPRARQEAPPVSLGVAIGCG